MPISDIRRSRADRVVAGVASGLAAYLGIDPLLVRIVMAILLLANGLGALLYLGLWLLMPAEGSLAADSRAVVRENWYEIRAAAEQLVSRIQAAFR